MGGILTKLSREGQRGHLENYIVQTKNANNKPDSEAPERVRKRKRNSVERQRSEAKK